MKYTYLLLVGFIISCNSNTSVTEADQNQFADMAQAYHSKYIEGSKNLDDILSAMDQDIKMWENGKIWTYADLEKFGPHLPAKNVIETYNQQKLLKPDIGYDYVSQLYISTISGDTLRETASRIWQKSKGEWKIVQMNNLIKPE